MGAAKGSEHYILDDNRNPIPAPDLDTWAKLMQRPEARRVAVTEIGGSRISTVFLALDHSFGVGEPLLFQTDVFGGPLDGEMVRCSTWEQAEAMHEEMCNRVRNER
jgi:hypothetical protein